MNGGSPFSGYRYGWSRWALHYNTLVLALSETATCIICSRWFQTGRNEMHLGLQQLAVVHSNLLHNSLAADRDSCKAEPCWGGYECSRGTDWRLLEITRLDCSFLLPPPAAAAYSRLFSGRRSSRPGLITDKWEGGHKTGEKDGDGTQKSAWYSEEKYI